MPCWVPGVGKGVENIFAKVYKRKHFQAPESAGTHHGCVLLMAEKIASMRLCRYVKRCNHPKGFRLNGGYEGRAVKILA
jgi:hypothetical protein